MIDRLWGKKPLGAQDEQASRKSRSSGVCGNRKRCRDDGRGMSQNRFILISSAHKTNRALALLRFSTTPACDLVSSPGTLAATAQSARLEIVHGKNNLRERHHGKFRSPHIRAGG